eukprot:548241-Prorocentrum_minimum.AAC.3
MIKRDAFFVLKTTTNEVIMLCTCLPSRLCTRRFVGPPRRVWLASLWCLANNIASQTSSPLDSGTDSPFDSRMDSPFDLRMDSPFDSRMDS